MRIVGMGLSICRSIVEAHGGRLWADVGEQRGAEFLFILPQAQKEEEITNPVRAVQRTAELREDTVSADSHRRVCEGNIRPRHSRRGPGQRH